MVTASELYVMGNGHELDRELLSAYFDGALAGSSLQEAQRLLATDQAAVEYLESLGGIRHSLKSLPSGRLPRDFAQSVLARARSEAAVEQPVLRVDAAVSGSLKTSNGSRADLIPSELDRSSVSPSPSKPRSGWGILVGLATAAAILALVVFRAQDQQGSQQGLLSQVETAGKSGNAQPDVDGDLLKARGDNPSMESQLAEAAVSPGSNLSNDPQPKETVAVSRGAGALEALRNDLRAEESNAAIDILMVVDTVLSEKAWRNDRFGEILKQAGIANVKSIAVDKDVQAALEETRMTAPLQTDAAGDTPSAAIVFLRARGKSIDAIIKDMFADRADFRQTTFDLAMDKPFNMLHKSLRKLAQQSGGDQPTACVLTSTKHTPDESSPFAPEFVAGRRKSQTAGGSAGLADPGSAGLGQQLNPIVELLVVLRRESSSSK